MKKVTKKLIALFLVISLFISNSNILLRTAVLSIAADGSEQEEAEIAINQEITKYIPYAYSDTEYGIILQQSLGVTVLDTLEMQESKYTITVPTYNEIAPTTIEITTEKAQLTQDNTQDVYYTIEDNTLTITQKEQTNEEYYITYYYDVEAYKKYLESTHVDEYPDGTISRIEKDEETGEVWAYIDFSWDPEENEGEMPSNRQLVDKTPIEINTKYEITNEDGTITVENKLSQELDIAIGSEITNNVKLSIAEIIKSKLYTKQAIDFEVENKINITKSDLYSTIKIKGNTTKFVVEDETKYNATIQYNTITINKVEFENILGTQGSIKLLDENSEIIYTINSETEVNEEGNYKYTYPESTKKITIEIDGIEKNGILNIKQSKTIISEQGYEKSEIANFKLLRIYDLTEIVEKDGNTQSIEQNVEILLKETITSANLSINNTNLSTTYENTGVEFSVELKNNNETSDLWENPFIIIQMPKEVENVTINSKNIVHGEEIEIHSAEVIEFNGNKAIKLQLIGSQQDYVSETIIGGTTIVVNTNITLKELTTTSNDNEINLYYYNTGNTNYENKTTITLEEEYIVGHNTALVNYIAPIEFRTIHKISEFDEIGTIVNSESSEKAVGKISILEPEKEVKQSIILMNNTGNQATNIKVLGRVPFVGNTDIVSAEDLETTVNAVLSKQIIYTGELEKEIQIYYSENGNADTNLENEENAWTSEVASLENIKSFMIVVTNIEQGEKLFFDYNIQVPGMLEHNENLYSSLVTYFTNNTETGAVEEISKANTVGLTTGIGARAQIELSAGLDEGTVFTEGQKVKYKIKVTNTGELPAEDVVVINQIPEGTTYVEETVVKNEIETFNKYTYYTAHNHLRWEIGKIEPSQSAELEYTLIINNIPTILEYYGTQEGFIEEDGFYYIISTNELGDEVRTPITDIPNITISNTAVLTSSNIEKELVSNELKNDVKKSYFDILEESSVQKVLYIEEQQDYSYIFVVENKTDLQMQNLQITKKIPEGVTYVDAEIITGSGNINYADGILTITGDTFEAYGTIEVIITVNANRLPEGVYKKEIITNTEVKAEGIEANTSSSVTNTIGRPIITASIECDVKQRYIYEEDILNYIITVKNENDVTASKLVLTNVIPENTKLVKASYTKNGNEYSILSDGTRNLVVETNLGKETMTIQIKVAVEKIYSSQEEIEIVNKATMKSGTIEETVIGEIRHTIINVGSANEGENGNEGGNNGGGTPGGNQGGDGNGSGTGDGGKEPIGGEIGDDGIERFKIKGIVWNDVNKDGEWQDNEDIIKGVTVYLVDEKGNIIKDYKTAEQKKAITALDGKYEFKNIEKGKYMLVYIFDDTKYSVTEYQKSGVVNDRNSDAILKNIIFEGKEQQVAITDIIEIKDRNIYSIDLGLKEKEKFNMMLEAGISSITVKSKEGTKQQAYDMANLAKVEIKSKYINGATVIIEYNLKVTNNGELAGSVSQIMASQTKGLSFISSENNDWYEGNDGNLYLISLANTMLNPGESTNVKLTLIKQMTSSNTGTIENSFKITKTYNDRGTQETTLEDNTAKTSCIITIATGQAIAYTGISILALTILAIGVYMIRRTLTKEKRWI